MEIVCDLKDWQLLWVVALRKARFRHMEYYGSSHLEVVRRGYLASILARYLANETHIYTLKLGKSRNSILYLK